MIPKARVANNSGIATIHLLLLRLLLLPQHLLLILLLHQHLLLLQFWLLLLVLLSLLLIRRLLKQYAAVVLSQSQLANLSRNDYPKRKDTHVRFSAPRNYTFMFVIL